jgi:hypothetical protein
VQASYWNGMLALTLVMAAQPVGALAPAAQELAAIQRKVAPDQCELRKLSAQDAAAKRDGDLAKRQELAGQMMIIVKRIQGYQPRMQELTQSVPPGSADEQQVQKQAMDLREQCKL